MSVQLLRTVRPVHAGANLYADAKRRAQLSRDCLAGDRNGDGQITVDEILAAGNELDGCPTRGVRGSLP